MGHLINPIALRLGHARSWEDNWFVRNLYYPEYLHSIFKIRNYLYFFFTTKYMERRGVLLSHFTLFKFVKILLIKIFLYNIDLEKTSNIYYYQGYALFNASLQKTRANITKETAIPHFYKIYNFDIFFLIYIFDKFFLKSNNYLKKKNLNILKKKKDNNLRVYYYYWNQWVFNLLKNKKEKSYIPPKFLKLFRKKKYIYYNQKKSKISRLDSKVTISFDSYVNMSFMDFYLYLFYKVRVKDLNNDLAYDKSPWKYDYIPKFFDKWLSLIKMYKAFKYLNFRSSKVKNKNHFIFYANFLLYFFNILKKKREGRLIRLRKLTFKFVRLIFYSKFYNKFTFFYGQFLRLLISIMTNIKNTVFKFISITNSSINAKFLARYIGLKLKRKHPLFRVINPIRRELRKFSFQKKESLRIRLLKIYGLELRKLYIINANKKDFHFIILLMNSIYEKDYFLYNKRNKSHMTFDLFIFISLLYKNANKIWKFYIYMKNVFCIYFYWIKKKRGFKLLKRKSSRTLKSLYDIIYIDFIKKYFSNYIFLRKSINILLGFLDNKLFLNLIFGANRLNFDFLYKNFFLFSYDEKIFQILNINFMCLVINAILNNCVLLNYNTLINIDTKTLSISNYFFCTFMDFMYSTYSFKNLEQYAKVNKRLLYYKIKEIYKSNSYLLGFKMSFKGRFSRKQRASSIWFHQGYVPLNTIKANIDFAFFSVPIKNSAVSIKLWLYKNTNSTLWNLQFLNKE